MVAHPFAFAAFECVIPLGYELEVLCLAHFVHGFIEVLGHMELVMHDLGVGQRFTGTVLKGGPQVHGDGLHPLALLLGQAIPHAVSIHLLAPLDDFQHT